tara:strand:+ start:232 stop:615 length:384 start_codon:yes stop_codon:yes gene_type:complete
MKTLKEESTLPCSAKDLWTILSDFGRCDWVPTIEKISLQDDCRYFEMAGMGQITEKILQCDERRMILQYSAIETPVPIRHHLATMKISEINDQECSLLWTTEISPEVFAEGIHQGMLVSIDGLKKIL